MTTSTRFLTLAATLALVYLLLMPLTVAQPTLEAWLIPLKPLPILVLAAGAFRLLDGVWRTATVAALLASATGDVLLELRIDGFDHFTFGLAAFLLAQLTYAWLFSRRQCVSRARIVLLAGYLIVAAVLAWSILPNTGALLIPVTAYLLAISMMVVSSLLSAVPLPWLALGAIVFVISDSLIAINRFVMPVPAAGFGIMSTYYLAQGLIWFGVVRGGTLPPRSSA